MTSLHYAGAFAVYLFASMIRLFGDTKMEVGQCCYATGFICGLVWQEQASWVCQCEDSLVTQLEKDFKRFLQDQHSLEEWSTWLQSVVDEVLKPYQQTENFTKAARQFLLKWSFYRSVIFCQKDKFPPLL